MDSEQHCLIIGASRGLGRAMAAEYLARGWHVTATIRGAAPAELEAMVAGAAGRLALERLDIRDDGEIAALRRRLDGRRFDQLFVNAGIASDPSVPIRDVAAETFIDLMLTNAFAPARVIEALADLVPPGGGIGAMSSSLGSIGLNESGGFEAYRASKAALNMLMRSLAARDEAGRAHVLADPGWVRTDMGGPQAPLSIEDSIPGVVNQLIAHLGRPGLAFVNHAGTALPW